MSFATLMLAVVLGVVGGLRLKHGNQGRLEPLMFWVLLLFVGVTGLYTGGYHCFMPQLAAETIGWSDSPFQWEVGIADFTIGVLGVMGGVGEPVISLGGRCGALHLVLGRRNWPRSPNEHRRKLRAG